MSASGLDIKAFPCLRHSVKEGKYVGRSGCGIVNDVFHHFGH